MGPHKLIRSGSISRFGFVGEGMTLLEEVWFPRLRIPLGVSLIFLLSARQRTLSSSNMSACTLP